MPTPYEQELLEMSRKANAVEVPKGPQLPDLDPNMFLSSAGAFEFQAAQALSEPRVDLVEQVARQALDHIHRAAERTVVASLQASERPSLESLFMASAARETGMDLVDAMSFAVASTADDFDIAYDADDIDTGARGVPNPAVRFQIGRESPPPSYFSASRQMTDGQVVATRSNGRFESTVPRIPYGSVAVRQAESRAPTPPAAPTPRYEAPAPSALDIISGDSFDNL